MNEKIIVRDYFDEKINKLIIPETHEETIEYLKLTEKKIPFSIIIKGMIHFTRESGLVAIRASNPVPLAEELEKIKDFFKNNFKICCLIGDRIASREEMFEVVRKFDREIDFQEANVDLSVCKYIMSEGNFGEFQTKSYIAFPDTYKVLSFLIDHLRRNVGKYATIVIEVDML